ncbi:hypothetical protein SUGI_0298350 [Cryptomeria japonica]|uniref:phospholipid-transporting ATPase 10 n=1 Tax=Cryptomeria japonica TaxID=3369 RepID=UPI002408B0EB|nr:phospholipid-transporting ATPase 10 [Cryptomeria japonica]GLJ17222.1 hypothetical protein SUGI_0298350 [Cryptomeria japonica]
MSEPGRRKKRSQLRKLYTFTCGRSSLPPDDSLPVGGPGFSRVVYCNEPEKRAQQSYRDNYVSTTKYNVATFFPKALFEQFRRVANIYFLFAAGLSLTPLAPFTASSLIAPLVFVVGVSMIKEAVEDWRRFLQDKEINNRKVEVFVDGKFLKTEWMKLMVGDVVKVEKNDFFPADLLLLSSSNEDGICYVETMNLDGETNLKIKEALEVTSDLENDASFQSFRASVKCEDPNPNLYTFIGSMEYKDQSYPLSPQQILLRDSKLRNTDYIYGVVIFSGHDTKVMQNATEAPSKRSGIERKMDKIILFLFSVLVLISLVGSIAFGIKTRDDTPDWWYLNPTNITDYYDPKKPALAAFLHFITALILYGYLIPISLYVSIEIVKVLQSRFINEDQNMYDEETDKPARARTSNLNEELGQVDTILSDKTGTLTCNSMEFLKCSIAGTAYGQGLTEVEIAMVDRLIQEDLDSVQAGTVGGRGKTKENSKKANKKRRKEFLERKGPEIAGRLGIEFSELQDIFSENEDDISNLDGPEMEGNTETMVNTEMRANPHVKGFNFKDTRIMNGQWVHQTNKEDIRMFFRILAICQTAIPEVDDSAETIYYEAESPDEAAFVVAAREIGFEFFKRTQNSVFLHEPDPVTGKRVRDPVTGNDLAHEYRILNILEFNSTRKRMSVIVKDEQGRLFLFSKGADSVIFERLSRKDRRGFEADTRSHISKYADAGLRTLALAYRELGEEEYKRWNKEFLAAKNSLGADRDAKMDAITDEIEKELILIGATAVEDKLQKGVPQCIDRLAQAGIKIWVLTGDKVETAINIGFACSLLRQGMEQLLITLDTPEINALEESRNKEQIAKVCHEKIESRLKELENKVTSSRENNDVYALIIDGKSLTYALHKDLKHIFLKIATLCASVICCRVSPKQKALITRLVKEGTGKTTLGIGDGANDVGMIQEADIGVGISGVEGMQAAMASDFSIAQFRFLERLLLVHGHWCYRRIATMICYFFYKNITFGFTLFYFEAYASFSAQPAYNDWYMSLFNVFFTSLPVLALGVFEQDVSAQVCLKFPVLYQEGIQNALFGWSRIVGWMVNGVYSSTIIFFVTTNILKHQAFREGGQVSGMEIFGATMYTCIVWTVNCQIALALSYFTWLHHLFIWGSVAFWYFFLFVYGSIKPTFSTTAYKVLVEACGPSPMYWFITLIVVISALVPYFTYSAFQRRFFPLYHSIIQWVKHEGKDRDPEWIAVLRTSRMRPIQSGFTERVEARYQYVKAKILKKPGNRARGLRN